LVNAGGLAITPSNGYIAKIASGGFLLDLNIATLLNNRAQEFQDADGVIALKSDITAAKNLSSTQWSKSLGTPSSLPNGDIANGFTFFDNVADKSTGGTTSYNEYDIAYGIDLTLTGTSGTANINIDGVDYLATFNTDLSTTVQDWLALHEATLDALNINVLYNGGSPLNPNGNETIRFCASEAVCNSVTITTVTGDLNGTRINPFTGVNAAAGDHVLVPYTGEPYEGKRIHHTFRVNFDITTGSDQTLALSLRRFANDSVIGSEIQVFRTQDVAGVQQTFASYTASVNDPFVTGGFYFALRNDSGVAVEISGSVGILIQNEFETPTEF